MVEHVYTELATGSLANRNNIVTIDRLPERSEQPAYGSLFLFDNSLQQHIEATGTVSAFAGAHTAREIAIDFDSTDLEQARTEAVKLIEHLAAVYEVPYEYIRPYFSGGKGFHLQIPIEAFTENPEAHPRFYDKVKRIVGKLADGVKYDRSIYNATRLFRLPNSRHNKSGLFKIPLTVKELKILKIENIKTIARKPREVDFLPAEEFEPVLALARLWEQTPHTEQRKAAPTDTPFIAMRLPAEVEELKPYLAKNDSEEDWCKIAFALTQYGEEGRKVFQWITTNNENYPDDTVEVADKKYDDKLKSSRHELGLGTLRHIAGKHGWKPADNGQAAKKIIETENRLNRWYEMKRDLVKEEILYRDKGGVLPFKRLDDVASNSIYLRLQKDGVAIAENKYHILINSDFVPSYNPVLDYLRSLQWDGGNHIADLCETVDVRGNAADFEESIVRWLVGAVATAVSDEHYCEIVPILQGGQGVGKTRWIRRLVPEPLKNYYDSGDVQPNNKDSMLRVVKTFIYNLDELESLKRDDIDALKALLSEKQFPIRKPYGRGETHFKRHCSFIGSVNRSEFLGDSTGSRRFLAFAVESIDLETEININQVWAQAYQLYIEGERWWFEGKEIQRINERNEEFEFPTVEEELLLSRYEPCEFDDPGTEKLTATDLCLALFETADNRRRRGLSNALSKHGFIQKTARIESSDGRREPRKVYAVRKRNDEYPV